MARTSADRNFQKKTDRDRLLAIRLADPDVDEVFASEHVRRECETIQAAWSESRRLRAAGKDSPHPLEITEIVQTVWLNGVPQTK